MLLSDNRATQFSCRHGRTKSNSTSAAMLLKSIESLQIFVSVEVLKRFSPFSNENDRSADAVDADNVAKNRQIVYDC